MRVLILTTPTCVKCKSYKESLSLFTDDDSVAIEIRNALDPDMKSLVSEFNITSVPFTIIYNEIGEVVYRSHDITQAAELSYTLNSLR